MLVIETDQHHQPALPYEARPTSGLLDVVAVLLVEDYCDHDRGRCLLDPPTWTYRIIGGHFRYSLGGLLCRVGQWASRRHDELPLVPIR